MVNDFMVCVDRILTTACFESVKNEGLKRERGENSSAKGDGEGCSKKSEKGEMVECRICQEEDEEREMEAPCACSGTLKVRSFLLFPCFFVILEILMLCMSLFW